MTSVPILFNPLLVRSNHRRASNSLPTVYYDRFPTRQQISQQSDHPRVFNVYRYITVSYCKINNQFAIFCAEFDFSEQIQFRSFITFQQEIVKRRMVFLLKLVRILGLWELETTGRLFCKAGRFKGAKNIADA